jgi:hypothetical protein
LPPAIRAGSWAGDEQLPNTSPEQNIGAYDRVAVFNFAGIGLRGVKPSF